MDIRAKAFFLCEAEAIQRQEMARMAQSVAAGMSDEKGRKEFIRSLELTQSSENIAKANWEVLRMTSKKLVKNLKGKK